MRYRFIDTHRGRWPVRVLCAALQVGPAGYYAWRDRPPSARQQRRDALRGEIEAIHARVKARYGSPRVHAELVGRGHPCCVTTVAKIMREAGIAAKTNARVSLRRGTLKGTPAVRSEGRPVGIDLAGTEVIGGQQVGR